MESTKVLLTQLKDNVVALTAKEVDLTQTVTRLTAKCEEQDRGSADRIKELEVTKQKNIQIVKELEGLQRRYAESEKEALQKASAPDKSVAAIALMTAAAEESKNEITLLTTKHTGDISSIQLKLKESEATIVEQKTFLSELTAYKRSSVAQIGDMEAKHTELESTIKKLEKNLKDATIEIESLTAKASNLTKAQLEVKDSTSKKIATLASDIQKHETAYAAQKTDLEASKANLAATTTAYSALSAQHNQVKAKVDHLSQQLEAELQQTQERKLKVRAYVDNINTEKREIEQSKQAMADQLEVARKMISTLEAAVAAEEVKAKKEEIRFNAARQSAILDLEQQQQDFMQRMAIQDEILTNQKVETAHLQGQLDEHAKATTEEVSSAYGLRSTVTAHDVLLCYLSSRSTFFVTSNYVFSQLTLLHSQFVIKRKVYPILVSYKSCVALLTFMTKKKSFPLMPLMFINLISSVARTLRYKKRTDKWLYQAKNLSRTKRNG